MVEINLYSTFSGKPAKELYCGIPTNRTSVDKYQSVSGKPARDLLRSNVFLVVIKII